MKHVDLKALVNSPDSHRMTGTCATFFPIDEDWGVKFFRSESNRNYAYDMQRHYETLLMAPLTGPKVECEIDGEIHYGYLTEMTECCDKAVIEHFGLDDYNGDYPNGYFGYAYGELYIQFLEDNPKWQSADLELRAKMEKHGIGNWDLHAGNWGINKMGEAVCIDFDKATEDRL